jgi:hypothetical protein
MARYERRILLLFAFGTALLASNTAWLSKDFDDWTDKDAQAVMTDSPWAKQMPMPAAARPSVTVIETGSNVASAPAASLGNSANTTSGTNMSNPASGGSNGPAEPGGSRNAQTAPTASMPTANTGAPAPPSLLTVIWASATPVRLAVLKLRAGATKPTADQIAHASAERPHYVIALVGLPPPESGSNPKALAAGAYLSLKGRPAAQALDSDYRRIGNADVYFFRFAKGSLPISPSDHSVEFKTTIGKVEVKKRFELDEMRYKGQLAL